MKLCALVGITLVVGCGSDGGSPASRLNGAWVFHETDTVGIGVTFSPDNTYVATILAITSTTQGSARANVQEEKGHYSVNGDQLTSTPTEWTCPGPDAVDTATFSFSGSNLVISQPSGIITFAPNNAAPDSTTFALTLGCFDANGNFTASPLAPVTN